MASMCIFFFGQLFCSHPRLNSLFRCALFTKFVQLDSVTPNNVLSHPELLVCNLRALKAAGVDGVMVDVWWGIVEGEEPRKYEWSAYQALFRHIAAEEMKIQVVMSFHQCGGNTGDSCYIPLPKWVLEVGRSCPDIFFTNREGMRNQEYLSFGVDEEPVLRGRTGVQVSASSLNQCCGSSFNCGKTVDPNIG